MNRVSLTRQQTLINLQTGRLHHRAIDDELITGTQHDNVIKHYLGTRNLNCYAVSPHHGLGLADHSKTSQGARGPNLLHDTDEGVGHDDEAEE